MHLLAETEAWLAVGFAATATLAVALSAVVALLLVRRRRTARAGRDVEALWESEARAEAAAADLARELERAREDAQRLRRTTSIASSIELDEVTTRTLEAADELPAVDAAVLVATPPEGEGEQLVATLGMSSEEAVYESLLEARAGNGPPGRAITVRHRYTGEKKAENGERIRGGIVVPLAAHGKPVGTLAVFWRGEDRDVSDAELEALEELAAAAGPAVENALRFREARQLADLDALTALHNRRFFHETLEREVARAQRYDRRLALVVFDIDDFKAVNDRIGHLGGDAVLADVADRVQSAVRTADIACRVGGDEFAVILPESTLADAGQLYRRIEHALTSRPGPRGESLNVSAGIAELGREDDAVSLFERADAALYRAKAAGKGQVAGDGGG